VAFSPDSRILVTGSADRGFATWYDRANERLTAFGTEVLYLVSDRAKALIKLAHTGLDVHFVHPSPVLHLDMAGDCGHHQRMKMSVLPDSRQGPRPCQYLMLPQ